MRPPKWAWQAPERTNVERDPLRAEGEEEHLVDVLAGLVSVCPDLEHRVPTRVADGPSD